MKLLKKILTLGLTSVLLAFSTGVAFASNNEVSPIITYNDGHNEIYQKTTTYNLTESQPLPDLDIDDELEGVIVGYTTIDVYVAETLDPKTKNVIDSRLMTNEEVEMLQSGFSTYGSGSLSKEKLTLTLVVTDTGSGTYQAKGYARWGGLSPSASDSPDTKCDDYIAITWGGEFKATSKNITGNWIIDGKDGSSMSTSHFNLNESNTYGGYLWSFKEAQRNNYYDAYSYVQPVVKIARTYPNTYQGKQSGVTLTYIHTYNTFSGSASLELSANPTGSISVSTSKDQWPLQINCSGISY